MLTVIMSLLATSLAIAGPSASRLLCAAAMVLCTFGDFAIMNKKPPEKHKPGKNLVLGGAFFIGAHLFYAGAYLNSGGMRVIYAALPQGLVLFAIAAGSVIVFAAKGKRIGPGLAVGAVAYSAVISFMCMAAFGYSALHGGVRWLCAAGALSFFISDYLIAARAIGSIGFLQGKLGEQLVWWFYPIGQIFLILFLA